MAVFLAASLWRHRTPVRRLLPTSFRAVAIVGACVALAACQTLGMKSKAPETARVVPDVPVTQGHYVVGKPYKENGVLYTPAEDWSYDKVGVASWYGIKHQGRRTANGETFDLRALTAAHPTLPLPSRVRVTNIENGKSIVVRVNDRGPFINGRLIDVSEHAAEVLGFKKKGTARVRVEVLGRAPLEMFRMAKPKNAPDLPVRAAPTASVKAAVLPPPSAAAEESNDKPVETKIAARDEGSLPETPADPVGELIDSMTAKTKAETAANEGGAHGEDAAAPAETQGGSAGGPSVSERLFIQAGAFTVPENAYSLRRLIMKAITGANVSINPAQVGSREFFRVRVGPFASTKEANSILAQLRNLGQNDARIIGD